MGTHKLPLEWVKHLKDAEGKKSFEHLLRNSTQILGRLRDILSEKENALSTQEHSIDDYNSLGWAFKQAFRNGQRSSLKEIKDLMNFIDK